MLETKFKVAILLAVLFMTSLPVMGILRGTKPPPPEVGSPDAQETDNQPGAGTTVAVSQAPIEPQIVRIPAGSFLRGTNAGGYDEKPEGTVHLDTYLIDRYEVTNRHYQEFRAATGHRKAAPPSRYAKNIARLRDPNQPVVYVSWEDADAYCRWRGKRLPTEAQWEKAMRGTDGRLWPWGNALERTASNWGNEDGYRFTAPVGTFERDVSPFGVVDGAGNVMEWVEDWYGEDAYRHASKRNPMGPDHGVYKVMRGGGYMSRGNDVRITSRSRMVPGFRDETIGFRCAITGKILGGETPAQAS
ncbi:MAG: SUMF1/EgtB/PvdO family nonheme iron enzyme [Nitrospirae bacterium]|nr:SUMF1/EgtB/PvdO family nonheme iron enzyme [Nitrospirota bacterium]